MNPETIFQKIKAIIGHIAWRIFLWSANMTQEEYVNSLYKEEKAFRENSSLKEHNMKITMKTECGLKEIYEGSKNIGTMYKEIFKSNWGFKSGYVRAIIYDGDTKKTKDFDIPEYNGKDTEGFSQKAFASAKKWILTKGA